jgi:two-component system NtrC family response regulator
MTARGSILVVDDEDKIRKTLGQALRADGHEVIEAPSARIALRLLADRTVDVLLVDNLMPDMTGLELIRELAAGTPDSERPQILIMTAHATVERAIEAMKLGALDFLQKPFEIDELLVVVRRALEHQRLRTQHRYLISEQAEEFNHYGIVGRSRSMEDVIRKAELVSETKSTVLITGDTGTGKELVARAIHARSAQRDMPLIKVSCAAIPDTLLESELFGHERGAFTGAVAQKAGKFELAHGGTLFLDEIGDMELATQAKVLRVLEDRELFRVGATKSIRVDVRIVAATNKNMEEAVRNKEVREDLYHRLNVFPIFLPPLRDRVEDIPLLVEHFLQQIQQDASKTIIGIAPDAMERLLTYSWPGNVRELRNCIERAMIMAEGDIIQIEDLPLRFTAAPTAPVRPNGKDLDSRLAEFERQWIVEALKEVQGVQAHAAKLLGITERSLWYRVKKLGLDIERIRVGEV